MSEAKKILFGNESRAKLKAGVDKLCNAVKVTLGPKGRTVIIQNNYGVPIITKDGVSVAKEVYLEDSIEDIGAQIVKDVALRTAEIAGDGTTTSIVLAQSMIALGNELIKPETNLMTMKKGMDSALEKVLKYLDSISEPINDNIEKVIQIASISANGDREIGEFIGKAMERVGVEGAVSIKDSVSRSTYVDVIEGLEIDRGYLSSAFVTDTARRVTEFDTSPFILVYDSKIRNAWSLEALFTFVATAQKALLIICDSIDPNALDTLVKNKVRVNYPLCIINAPSFGENRIELMKDIAAMTGAPYLSEKEGYTIEEFEPQDLGSADSIIVSDENTIIIGGKSDPVILASRMEDLKIQREKIPEEDRADINKRIAGFNNGVAVVYVGAQTNIEQKEKYDRVEDALFATKAAMQTGILPGGGAALFSALKNADLMVGTGDFALGEHIVFSALSSPVRTILENAGITDFKIMEQISITEKGHFGIDAITEKIVDLKVNGIIDPTKVTKEALKNAVSVAGSLLTTECVISELQPDGEHMPKMY
jgi:chaperonin GroEL